MDEVAGKYLNKGSHNLMCYFSAPECSCLSLIHDWLNCYMVDRHICRHNTDQSEQDLLSTRLFLKEEFNS